MNKRDNVRDSTAVGLPRWLAPFLFLSALFLGYGSAERLYDWSRTGSLLRGLSSVGFALLAVFNIAVALRLIRRRA